MTCGFRLKSAEWDLPRADVDAAAREAEAPVQRRGWIGVDLDGTLAQYDGWQGVDHIGAPVPAMVARVKAWRAEGWEVRIFTARAFGVQAGSVNAIARWSLEHLGESLPVTCEKDFGMVALWDDRCVQVGPNTGEPTAAVLRLLAEDVLHTLVTTPPGDAPGGISGAVAMLQRVLPAHFDRVAFCREHGLEAWAPIAAAAPGLTDEVCQAIAHAVVGLLPQWQRMNVTRADMLEATAAAVRVSFDMANR